MKLIAAVPLLLLSLYSVSRAQVSRWPSVGDTSLGVVTRMAVASDGALLAASTSGLFRSIDSGRSWRPLDRFAGKSVLSVAADANARVYVIEAGEGGAGELVRSLDTGRTWSSASSLPSSRVRSMALSSRGELIVIAGADSMLLYRSTDGGTTWKSGGSTKATAATFSSSGGLLAWSPRGAIYRSAAGGRWERLVAPDSLPEDAEPVLQHVVPVTSRVLLAYDPVVGMKRTTDAGARWETIDPGGAASLSAPLVDRGERVYVGIPGGMLVSRDGGESWRRLHGVTAHEELPTPLLVDRSGHLFASTLDGELYRIDIDKAVAE